jgi:hypothetical protein
MPQLWKGVSVQQQQEQAQAAAADSVSRLQPLIMSVEQLRNYIKRGTAAAGWMVTVKAGAVCGDGESWGGLCGKGCPLWGKGGGRSCRAQCAAASRPMHLGHGVPAGNGHGRTSVSGSTPGDTSATAERSPQLATRPAEPGMVPISWCPSSQVRGAQPPQHHSPLRGSNTCASSTLAAASQSGWQWQPCATCGPQCLTLTSPACYLKAGGWTPPLKFRQHTYPVLMECIEATCTLHDQAVMEPGRGKVIWRRYLPLRYSSIRAKGMRQVAGSGQF